MSPEVPRDPQKELQQVADQVKAKNRDEIKQEILDERHQGNAADIQQAVQQTLQTSGRAPDDFDGKLTDPGTAKAKAVDVQRTVWMALLAAKDPAKIPVTPSPTSPFAEKVLTELAGRLNPLAISEQTAPYFYNIVASVIEGTTTDVEGLSELFKKDGAYLQAVSNFTFNALRKVLVNVAKHFGDTDQEAEDKFRVKDITRREGTEAEAQRYHELFNKLREHYDNKIKQATDADKERLLREWDDINVYFYMGKDIANVHYKKGELLHDPTQFELHVRDLLANSNLRGNEWKELLELALKLKDRPIEIGGYAGGVENIGEIMKILRQYDDNTVLGLLFERDPKTGKPTKWNEAGAQVLFKESKHMLTLLYQKLDENPNQEVQTLFNDLVEGGALREILKKFYLLSKSETILKDLSDENKAEFIDFFKRKIIQEIYFERNHREMYHTIRFVIQNAEPKQWAQYLSRYNLSEFSVMSRDKIVNIAISQWKTYVQEKLIQNDNVVPPNLFSGAYKADPDFHKEHYSYPDTVEFKKQLRDQLTELGVPYQQWEIDRAFSLAQGISFATFEVPSVLAASDPAGNFKGLPFQQALTILNSYHTWQYGRGGHTISKEPSLFPLEILTKEIKRNLTEAFTEALGHGWVPREWKEKGDEWVKDLENLPQGEKEARILDLLQIHAEGGSTTWFDAIRKITIGSWLDRGGNWRTEGVEKVYKEGRPQDNPDKKEVGDDWEQSYRWFWKEGGVILGHLYAMPRAENEAELYLLEQKLVDKEGKEIKGATLKDEVKNIDTRTKSEVIKEFTDAGKGGGKSRFEKTMPVIFDGVQQKWTYNEYAERRQIDIKGQTFYHLLQKDPMAFLNSLSNILPKITEGTVEYTLVGSTTKVPVRASEYYFDPRYGDHEDKALNIVSAADIEKRDRVRRRLVGFFGAGNDEDMKFVMNFYADLYDSFGGDKKVARAALVKSLTTGYEKTRNDPNNLRPAMSGDDITQAAADSGGTDEQKIKRLMFGASDRYEGFITHYQTQVGQDESQYFGNGRELMGKKHGFFQTTASAWTRFAPNLVPNGDLNHTLLFEKASVTGEDGLLRNVGDLNTYGEIQQQILPLYRLIKQVATTGGPSVEEALKPILELHTKIKNFEGMIGPANMREIEFYVATVVTRFLQQHWISRVPGTITALGMTQLDEVALSTMSWRMGAYTMGSDEIRWYAEWLTKHGCLNKGEGLWSIDMFRKMVGVGNAKFTLEIVPNIGTVLMLILLWKYINDSMAEVEGKKKAA